jgi:hypothetical protein
MSQGPTTAEVDQALAIPCVSVCETAMLKTMPRHLVPPLPRDFCLLSVEFRELLSIVSTDPLPHKCLQKISFYFF